MGRLAEGVKDYVVTTGEFFFSKKKFDEAKYASDFEEAVTVSFEKRFAVLAKARTSPQSEG